MSPLIYGVAVGTIVVALLDATDGVIYFWLTAHLNPIGVLQYIASGALGAAAYSGGLATAFAGLVFHFVISLAAVSVFAALYTRSGVVRNHAPVVGLAYGAVVWCFMNLVVLPLSAVTATGVTPPNGTSGMKQTAGPVYAEYNQATAQLVVANYDGGTISVIDVSEDEYGNDSATFGTTYTIPVGNNPASVTVLADGTRAYTANQTDETVTIVTLNNHTVEKTLPITGHPRTVVSTQNSQYGKVYVASPDSPYLTILRTDLDLVDTTVLVEGNVVDVRVTTANGSQGNVNDVSRVPGYGQPCNLPPATGNPTPPVTGTQTLLQACQTQP